MRYVNNCMTIASNSLSFHFQKHPHLRGENWRTLAVGRPSAKHPHLRGENIRSARRTIEARETSPPAWGKRDYSSFKQNTFRNIPTCVGKTKTSRSLSTVARKHPHLRGENNVSVFRVRSIGETSPPAWGKRFSDPVHIIDHRNIPTCVGKTRAEPVGRTQ